MPPLVLLGTPLRWLQLKSLSGGRRIFRSSSAPVSPSIDLEDCIAQEMEAQAGISTDVGVIPYLRTPLLLHQKKNVLRMTQLEERGHGILLMDAIGMGKTCESKLNVLVGLPKKEKDMLKIARLRATDTPAVITLPRQPVVC